MTFCVKKFFMFKQMTFQTFTANLSTDSKEMHIL